MADDTRIELRLPKRSADRLKTLVVDTEAASSAEVMRNAIRLYEWIVSEAKQGKQFGMRSPGGEFEVVKIFAMGEG